VRDGVVSPKAARELYGRTDDDLKGAVGDD